MNGNILGIDIRRRDVCAVFLGAYGSERRIEAHASIPMEERNCWDCVADALEALQRHVDITGAVCVASVPDDWVSYRRIQMPFADPKKIEKVITFELEPLLPFPINEVIIDFVVGATASENRDGAEVLAAVIPRERISDCLDRFSDLGLDPSVIVPRGYAVAAMISSFQDTGAFVEADAAGGTVAAIHGGRPYFVRSFALNDGIPTESRLKKITAQVRHSLLACREQAAENRGGGRVYLTGDVLPAKGLAEKLEETFGISVTPMDMAVETGLMRDGGPPNHQLPDQQWVPARMDVALCLALVKQTNVPLLNFRKGEFAVAREWRQFTGVFAKTGALALLVLVIWSAGFFYELYQKNHAIAEMDARINAIFKQSFPEIQRIVDPVAQMRNQIERLKESSGLPKDMRRQANCVDILNEVSRLTPDGLDVVVSRLVAGPNDVVISGHTDAFNSVDTIKNQLGKSEYFGRIEITSANMDKIDQRVRFKLQVALL